MSPVSRVYKAGSIIYFEGDKAETVFVLQAGVVLLTYISPEGTGEVRENIKSGEFFGVKSALGRFPREETATVLSDATTMVMNVAEFEQLVLQNHKLVMKMLKVFSNQLRRIGRSIQTRTGTADSEPSGTGLFNIGEYYLKNKKFNQALYAYQKYLQYYPDGEYGTICLQRVEMAQSGAATGYAVASDGSSFVSQPVAKPAHEPVSEADTPAIDGDSGIGIAKRYFDAFSLYSSEKYDEAYKLYKTILDSASGGEDEYVEKTYFDIGRCLFNMNKPQDAITQLTTMVKTFPTSPNLKAALFHIGKCYAMLGDTEKAKGFYNKVRMMPPNESINKRAQKAIEELGGSV
ncbi:MAG TPA: tetratricopeptide repeat protein [Spirochaetota bacterium]|nr:tetratricopeptide repeat protein [Spirochaetota bacterium]